MNPLLRDFVMKKIKLLQVSKLIGFKKSLYGEEAVISKKQVQDVTSDHDLGLPSWFTRSPYTVNRGMYKLPNLDGNLDIEVSTIPTKSSSKSIVAFAKPEKKETPEMVSNVIEFPKNTESYVPEKVNGYVKFGHYGDVKIIKKAGSFYPVFITGLSGNGKTMGVTQACAEKKELFRVNITIETDEDDLIGGFRLVNGETVFQKGPVVKAMERGCILLIDEIDRATNKIMCLQGVLEGNPILLKKTGEVVTPADGFNVIATANTKGRVQTMEIYRSSTLTKHFLRGFLFTLEQEYPTISVEKNIIKKLMSNLGCLDEEYAVKLVDWADLIRKTFYDGGVDEIISTRRLVHIVNAFSIFKDRMKAISMCVARFDDQTKDTFMDLYSKLDETVTLEETEEVKPVVEEVEDYS